MEMEDGGNGRSLCRKLEVTGGKSRKARRVAARVGRDGEEEGRLAGS